MAAATGGISSHISQNYSVPGLGFFPPKDLAAFMQVSRAFLSVVKEISRVQTFRAFDAVKVPSSTGEEVCLLDKLGIRELLARSPVVAQPPPLSPAHPPTGPRYQDLRRHFSGSILLTPHLRSFFEGPAIIVSVHSSFPDLSGVSLTAFIITTEGLRIGFKSPEAEGIETHRNDTFAKMNYCAKLIRGIPCGMFMGADRDEPFREVGIVTLDRPHEEQPHLAGAVPPTKKT